MTTLANHRETDWLGNEYGVGDMILYPRTSGHSVEMVKAEVVEFVEPAPGYHPDHVVRVRVRPVESSRFSSYGVSGPVLLTNIENITKI